jgi:hypothetical protein
MCGRKKLFYYKEKTTDRLGAGVDHLAGGEVEFCEQIHGPVTLVVMGHRLPPGPVSSASSAGAVQRLALRLFVEAEHHRPLRQVHVRADNVGKLLLEARIVGQLERLYQPRLELMITPHPRHRVLADTQMAPYWFTSGRGCSPCVGKLVVAPNPGGIGWLALITTVRHTVEDSVIDHYWLQTPCRRRIGQKDVAIGEREHAQAGTL